MAPLGRARGGAGGRGVRVRQRELGRVRREAPAAERRAALDWSFVMG